MVPKKRLVLADELRKAGAVSRGRALELGLSDHDLCKAVKDGELDRTRTSLYASSAARDDRLQQIREDVQSWQPRAVACRAAALEVHNIRFRAVPFRREVLSFTTNGPERPEPPYVHRTRSLPEEDVTVVDGVAVTTLARTVIDLAGQFRSVQRIELLDHVIAGGHVSQDLMFARCDALWRGRGGVSELRRLTSPDAAAVFFSRLERLGAPLLESAGIQDAAFNVVPLRAPAAKRCDAVSEVHRLVVEWDGLRFHSSPAARQADNDKGNALAGRYTLLRFTWRDVMERPGYVIAAIARAIGQH